MDSSSVIQSVIDVIDAQTYLEIGVNEGDSFFALKAPRKIGVDPHFRFGYKRKLQRLFRLLHGETYPMTSDAFFSGKAAQVLKNGIDIAFVDGMHTYQQALRDVINCLHYLNEDGIIVMHDCNPPAASFATPAKDSIEEILAMADRDEIPGWTGLWNGDVWKAVLHLRALYREYTIFTLDIHWGLAIISRKGPGTPLDIDINTIATMSYEDLARNREALLNLKEPKYLYDFLGRIGSKKTNIHPASHAS